MKVRSAEIMKHQRMSGFGLLVVFLGLSIMACGGGGGGGPEDELANVYPPGTTGPAHGGGGGPVGTGGGGTGGGGTPSLDFRVLMQGDFALATSAAFPVARSQAEMNAIYQQYLPPIRTFAPTEVIDFSKEIIVGIFTGYRPVSGYSAAVLAVDPNGDGATVSWEERQPAPGSVGATVVTGPFVLIAMTKVPGAIDFNGKVTVGTP
jgi:hypothetical protein